MAYAGRTETLRFGKVVSETAAVVTRQGFGLLVIELVFDFLPAVAIYFGQRLVHWPDHRWPVAVVTALLVTPAYALRVGAAASLTLADRRGEPGGPVAAAARALARFPAMLVVTSILYGPIILLRFLPILLVSGHYTNFRSLSVITALVSWAMIGVGVFFAPLAGAAVDRRRRGFSPGRALALSRDHRWKITSLHMLWLVPVGIAIFMLTTLSVRSIGVVNIFLLLTILLRGLGATVLTALDAVIYLNLLAAKEGDESADVSAVFD
jgi:hypothetical protein